MRTLGNSPTSSSQESNWEHVRYKSSSEPVFQLIPFSAFWLRSSVVFVLINLISDMWTNGSHDIKLLFWGEEATLVACYLAFCVSPMRCTIALAWRTPSIQVINFFLVYLLGCYLVHIYSPRTHEKRFHVRTINVLSLKISVWCVWCKQPCISRMQK